MDLMRKQFKRNVQLAIDNTRDERFEIEEQSKALSAKFHRDEAHLGLAVTVATRAKTHRLVDEVLQKFKRFSVDGVAARLARVERLVRIYLAQMQKLAREGLVTPEDVEAHRAWFTAMLPVLNMHYEKLVEMLVSV